MTDSQVPLFDGEREERDRASELWRLWTEASRATRPAFLDRIRRNFLERGRAKRGKKDSEENA